MKYITTVVCFSLFFALCQGQRLQTPTLSPFSKISQEIGLTEVSLEYSRPSAKGRVVFGELVPFDQLWRTGANASTKLTFSEAVEVGGHPIDSGTYALYTIPGKEFWTIIIHSNTRMRSVAGDAYDKTMDVCRFEVSPVRTDNHIETFTIQFTDISTNACHVQLSWENTIINIPIEVEVDAKIEEQMAEFMQTPETIPHRTYFEAAQYNLHNDKDLSIALSYIDAALEKSPSNYRYGLLKAKIQDKDGDRAAAMKTIDEAHQWAREANNDNYIEQTQLFKRSLVKKEN